MTKEAQKEFAATGMTTVDNYGYDSYFIMDPNKTAKNHKMFANKFINHMATHFKG
jgi:hypothetical protein